MNKTVKIILLVGIIILFSGVIFVINILLEKSERIPENPIYSVGNTAGNLYNDGLFCEADGMIYFSNPYDNHSLYRMEAGQTNITRISTAPAEYINVLGNYIYYYSPSGNQEPGLGFIRGGRGIYRLEIGERNPICLVKATTDSMLVAGNTLFYTDITENENDIYNALVTVRQIGLNDTQSRHVFTDHIRLGAYNDGILYYAGMNNDHYLHTYNLTDGAMHVESMESMYLPIYSDGYLFYLDLNDDYKLKRYSFTDGECITLVNERIDTYNLYNSIIYYQTCNEENYQLRRIYTDGTGDETVCDGVFKNIQITSEYVYFTEFGSDVPIYQTSTYGAVNISTFSGAAIAANEYIADDTNP